MDEPLVDIRDLSKTFGKDSVALNKVSASLPKGRILGLVGPDGAGKTTLIRLIANLLLPSSGSIQTAVSRDSIGYMPQRFGLYEDLTVRQNLDLYADLKGLGKAERKDVFEEILRFTALGPFTGRLAGNLSGGMKQKLGLGCALLKKPSLLLLDEPSVGVDPISRRELWKMVQNLIHEKITVLWSTAYLDEAERCDSVLLLHQGKLLYNGPPKGLADTMEGRVYKVEEKQRTAIKALTRLPQVIDAALLGSELRVVLAKETSSLSGYQLTPIAPRFEDAFIDILGGAPKGESKLSALYPKVDDNIPTPVVAKDLVKTFGSFTAVEKVNFSVKKGEIFGFLGPNGAGKSTTFKMLCGLLKPTSGQAMVNNLDVQATPAKARMHIGYMAQKFSLYGHLSVRQNLTFYSGIYNLQHEAQAKAIEEMLGVFALQPYANASAGDLPLGFKQRLSLACATMHHPEVLFLDEPTSGVDPLTRREFWQIIYGLVEKGVTVLVTTHFMDEAEYCDRIALIYRGHLVRIEPPEILKELAKTEENPTPTLEDAFIQLIEDYDLKR